MDLKSNIQSIPYLLYMSENEKENDNGKSNSIWRGEEPPLADNEE